jgi:uncharacterized protein YlzI (FlbEa/FlbD family)
MKPKKEVAGTITNTREEQIAAVVAKIKSIKKQIKEVKKEQDRLFCP